MIDVEINGNTLDVTLTDKHAVKNSFIETLRRLDLGPPLGYREVLNKMMASMIGTKIEDIQTGSVLKELLEHMGDEEE